MQKVLKIILPVLAVVLVAAGLYIAFGVVGVEEKRTYPRK